MFAKIALLYMRKHGKRTLVVLAAIALSVTVMLFIDAMLFGVRESFFRGLFQDTGHLQVHERGFADRLDPYSIEFTIRDPDAAVTRLMQDPRVNFAEKILPFGALLINGEKNLPIGGVGIEKSSDYYGRVVRGMKRGSLPTDEQSIAISTRVAHLLDLSFGDPVIALVQDSQGSAFYMEYAVAGLFDTGSDQFDTSHFFLLHPAAQELLYLGDATVEVRANLHDPEEAKSVAEKIAPFLGERSLVARTWRELHGSYIVAFELFDIFVVFIDIVVVVVTSTVIINTILMNVFERTGEIGTLRAIGLRRSQQLAMIVTEGAIEGGAGAALGLLIGIPLTLLAEHAGVPVGQFSESFGLGRVVYPSLSLVSVVRSFVAGVVVALIGSGYASMVSARRPIVRMIMEA
jgi:putative ABC transport system permease protein